MGRRLSIFVRYRLLFTTMGIIAGLSAMVIHYRKMTGPLPELTTDVLGNFVFDQYAGTAADIPQSLRRLDGRRVTVLGDVWNLDSEGKTWALTKLSAKDEHRPPLVQQFVFCHSESPIQSLADQDRVTGVLHIQSVREGERVVKLFQLDVEEVQPIHRTR